MGPRAEGSLGTQAGPVFGVGGAELQAQTLRVARVTRPHRPHHHRPPAAPEVPMRRRLEALLGYERLLTEERGHKEGETQDSGGGPVAGPAGAQPGLPLVAQGCGRTRIQKFPVTQGAAHLWGLCLNVS